MLIHLDIYFCTIQNHDPQEMDCNISNQGMELDRGIQVRSMICFRCLKVVQKSIPNMLIHVDILART